MQHYCSSIKLSLINRSVTTTWTVTVNASSTITIDCLTVHVYSIDIKCHVNKILTMISVRVDIKRWLGYTRRLCYCCCDWQPVKTPATRCCCMKRLLARQ